MSTDVDVLLVDDEADVRASSADILRDAGFSVDEAQDGLEALAHLRRHRVGAVVLDVSMPRCDGIEVVARLDDPPPILIVSARAVDDGARARVDGKVWTYLSKPVPPARLVELVTEALKVGGST